ncbi:hypothetical protein V6N12_057258 [Hibiscus sabdariffa]|uniref:Uncharacterized protein n=1 Tax=Hibiscus sabdariffa TaxID=183260 RepID=A0ABR2DBD1_9ROSI
MLSILTQIFLFLHTAAWDSGRLPPLADDFPCVLNNCVVAIVTDRVRIAWFLSAVVSCAVSVAESCLLGDYSLSLLNPRFGFFGRRSWTVQGPGSWFSGAKSDEHGGFLGRCPLQKSNELSPLVVATVAITAGTIL